MSPRRKFQPGERPSLAVPTRNPRRLGWRLRLRRPPRPTELPLLLTFAALITAGAITVCAWMLVKHQSQERTAQKNVAVLSYVSSFMTEFTSVDPFHANDYINRILAEATGDFEKQYQDQANEILVQIGSGEPTTGTVLDAGVERWNDDGSANVLVATQVASKSPDGKQVFDSTDRWVATARQEGNAWKISSLSQVI